MIRYINTHYGVQHIVFKTNLWLVWKCYNCSTKSRFHTIGSFSKCSLGRINFFNIIFGLFCSNQRIKMSYQTIIQWELLHKNHHFTHISNLFFIRLLNYWFVMLYHHFGFYVKRNCLDVNIKHMMSLTNQT
jgi:hypothetical protein